MEERKAGTWCEFATRLAQSILIPHVGLTSLPMSSPFHSYLGYIWSDERRCRSLCSSIFPRRSRSYSLPLAFFFVAQSNQSFTPFFDHPPIQQVFTPTLFLAEEPFDFITSSPPLPPSSTRLSTTRSLAKSSLRLGTTTNLRLRRSSSRAGRWYLLWLFREVLEEG